MDNNIQKTYDKLSKPTESEKLQDELEPIVHPAMERKQVKEKTSEVESEKSNFHIQQTNKPNLGDDYSSPKEPPKDETRKRKPEFKKSKLKEPREKKDVKKGIQEVKEIPLYDMPQDTKDRIKELEGQKIILEDRLEHLSYTNNLVKMVEIEQEIFEIEDTIKKLTA